MTDLPPDLSTEALPNFLALSPRWGTGGQPGRSQFRALAEAGYEAVVNLALPTSDNALPDEGAIATGLGLAYFHIPVRWEAPTPQDLDLFFAVMDGLRDRKTFVHCAKNMRVSAFCYLYRVRRLGEDRDRARRDLHRIWEPNAVWADFIARADIARADIACVDAPAG